MDPDSDFSLVITARGPATTGGRLPLSELARVAGEFQATLERIALGLSGGAAQSGGRRPADIVEAVRLEIRGFRVGSAVLEVDRAQGALFDHELLAQSFEVLEAGASAIVAGDVKALPEPFTAPVLDGLLHMSGGIAEAAVAAVDFDLNGHRMLHVDSAFRQAVRVMRRSRHYDQASLVGRLQMGDFALSALRCRIDTIDSSILCNFDESMRPQVLADMDSMVIASGIAEFGIGGTMRSLDLVDLEVVPEGSRRTFEELAAEQGVGLISDAAEFGLSEDVPEDDFESFFQSALSARAE
ncbi:hypothetical protein [Blastococcus sp. TF02A-35]|uniref:hypothetical protein n=1 Tax=Blastococcus sp. TF02A-35 TaxID=2559612 RepID=UPI001073A095|nr:hypothetical protein [Blastococcus sp. TF02A_35]TFV49542.1 hypothetical protein E4P43_11885 [Blastococcus sp. TF02A_35]